MTDLLPCPFCGGEVRIVLFKDEFDCYWWAVARSADDETACHCRVFMECDRRWQVNEGDEPEDYPLASMERRWLIEKWNTRAERTCRNLDKHHNIMFKCSECGHWECQDFDGEKILPQTWNYCPNCGRRVVNNDN